MNSPAKTSVPGSPIQRADRASTRAYNTVASAGASPQSAATVTPARPTTSQRTQSPVRPRAINISPQAKPMQKTTPQSPPSSALAANQQPWPESTVGQPPLAEASTPAMTHARAFPTSPTMARDEFAAGHEPMTPKQQVISPEAAANAYGAPEIGYRAPVASAPPSAAPAMTATPAAAAAPPPPAQPATSHHHHHHRQSSTHHQRVQKRTSIGPWDFVKSVGAGSMGQVKLAVNRYTRQSAAVKIVPKAFTQKNREGRESNEAKDARVIREAAIGKIVYHPNISRLFEVYSMSSHYYLVFEYIAGGQMLDYIITHGSVKETQARRFARSIASALDYCHRNSIVHRDLKIENILIADGGDVKIIDFGLSNLFRRDNLLKTFCGSLYFAAPELLNALPYVGPEVDVWSFGVVLYVLVCGKVPFEDKSMAALHAKIKRGEVDYPTWLSPLCTDLLSRMLVVSPSERATMREVIHHPWMNKGFDSIVESYVPERSPLELPLDEEVLNEMVEMNLAADSAVLRFELESVLQSPQYMDAVAAWYDARASSSALPSRAADPLNSYHPYISMYFLTRERIARESAITSAASGSSQSTTPPLPPTQAAAPSTPQAAAVQLSTPQPALAAPAVARARSTDRRTTAHHRAATTTAATTTVPNYSASGSRRVVTGPVPKPEQQPAAAQTITVAAAKPPQAAMGRLRSRTVGNADQHVQMYSDMALKQGYLSPNEPGPTPPISPQVLPADRRSNLSSLFRRISLRRRSGRSESMERAGDVSVEGLASQPSSREPSRERSTVRRMPSRHSGHSGELAETPLSQGGQTLAPPGARAGGRASTRVPTHVRAKSTGHPAPAADPVRPSHSRQASQLSERIDEEMPSIESPRQVFFKGFFSVQSTSTKSLLEIRAEIIRVLTELAIDFVEIKGGFACIHGASPSSTAATTLPVSVTSPRQPSHRRGPSFGATSPHASPLRNLEFSSSSDSVELTGSDMLGNEHAADKPPSPVRFEISIVRVPLLSLHGVQFKKLTGDVWRYKSIAQEILEHLKL